MNCLEIEERLSAYMESDLPAVELKQVEMHLKECSGCAALLDAMHHTVSLCRDFPELEIADQLVDRILVRTSGHPRPMSVFERFRRFVIQPLLVPRFAVGTGMTVLFFALLVNFILPPVSVDVSSTSPSQIYTFMDRSVQHIYSKGLKAYDIKNEWQAQLTYFKSKMIHRLQFMIERFDIPTAETKAPFNPDQQKESIPQEKYRTSFPVHPMIMQILT